MRFYISADIEGICGVVTGEHTRPGGCEYEAARRWMTNSVLAVSETARAEGAEQVVVSDSHGNGLNIHLDAMPDYVRLVRSWPRPLGMMQGIESGAYDAAFLVGYHAGGSNPGGVLSHTMSSALLHEIRLNGKVASEAVISAVIAGAHGVPVAMVAGDDVAVAETRELLGDVEGAELMRAYGTHSAICPSPEVALQRLREATRRAIARRDAFAPYRIAGPIEVMLKLRTRAVAEWLSYLPETERLDAYSIRYGARDAVAMSRFLMFVTMAGTALAS